VAVTTALETIWGLGLPFCAILTVAPLYLLYLQASKLLIQSLLTAAQLLVFMQLWSSRACTGTGRKRRNASLWGAFGLCWGIYGVAGLAMGGVAPSWVWIPLFSLAVLAASACSNLAGPVYGELLIDNFPKRRLGQMHTLRRLGQGLAGMLATLLTAWLMSSCDEPTSFHLRFVIGALLFVAASATLLPFLDMAAWHRGQAAPDEPVLAPVRRLFADMNFRTFLVFQMLVVAAGNMMPLMLGYGQDVLRLGEAEQERFILVYFAGATAVGLCVPALADRLGFRAIAIVNAALLAVAFALPVVAGRSPAAAYLAYALYAGTVGLSPIIMANLGAELVPSVRPATIIAVGGMMTMPLSLGLAPVGGWLVDAHGSAGYLCAFVVGATLSCCAAAGLVLIVREPRTGQELYVRIRKD
jgi:MFS family permease